MPTTLTSLTSWLFRRWAWTLAAAIFLAGCGGGTSSPTELAPTPVSISAQPVDQAVTAGGTAQFSVSANGDSIRYQWQLSIDAGGTWTDVGGANAATLSLANVNAGQSGHRYRVAVIGTANSVTSSAVALTVAATVVAPAITVDAASQSVTAGANVSFSVTATGTTPAYQWQSSSDGAAWSDISGASGATLTLTAVSVGDNGRQFRAIVSNSAGSVTGGAAILQVVTAPAAAAVAMPPASLSVQAPAAATFAAAVTGSPAPTLQWQQSTDAGATFTDIGGATGSSYTLAATALSDNGKRFRIVATNASGTATSSAATLTVTASPVAATVIASPVSATVTAGATASFSATVGGTPAPAVQWQISRDAGASFANINGATATAYTTPATVLADNNNRYRIVATNASGSATSAAATLTVNAPANVFQGRAWATGQQLEVNDNDVLKYAGVIDDLGRVTVLFTKSDGTRNVLWATRGVANGAGLAPTWSTPVAIDTSAPINTSYSFSVNVSPAGNVAAAWTRIAPCTGSSYNTSGNCNYRIVARYLANTGAWEAPVTAASTPTTTLSGLEINDAGDVVVDAQGWVRSGSSGHTRATALTWRVSGEAAFRQQVLPDADFNDRVFHLSRAGDLVLVGEAEQNATDDIVAYRGTVTTGLGAQEVLDSRGADAKFRGSWANPGSGRVVLMWNQNNGTSDARYAAALDSPTGAWSVTDLGYSNEVGPGGNDDSPFYAVVKDDGDFVSYRSGDRVRRVAGVWSGLEPFEAWGYFNYFYSSVALLRDGSALVIRVDSSNTNSWAALDGPTQTLVQPFVSVEGFPNAGSGPGYVIGVSAGTNGFSLLSKSGIGAYISVNTFDVLPTVAQPAGDGRGIDNLWGFFFK